MGEQLENDLRTFMENNERKTQALIRPADFRKGIKPERKLEIYEYTLNKRNYQWEDIFYEHIETHSELCRSG